MADDVPEGQDDSYLLEAQVGHLIRRAHQRHVALFAEHFADADLTPTQWAALAKLRERGTLSQNLLGRLTAMDPATIQGSSDVWATEVLSSVRPTPRTAGDRPLRCRRKERPSSTVFWRPLSQPAPTRSPPWTQTSVRCFWRCWHG